MRSNRVCNAYVSNATVEGDGWRPIGQEADVSRMISLRLIEQIVLLNPQL